MKETNNETKPEAKVVSLFANRENTKEAKSEEAEEGTEGETFAEIVARNMANKERLKRERNNANKSVLRSYRIKN